MILESTFCGSYAPGALPPEEPKQDASGAEGGLAVLGLVALEVGEGWLVKVEVN